MTESKKHYNIMTSCNDSLIAYVAVGITAMSINLNEDEVDFYFFHSDVKPENIKMLDDLCGLCENIDFHEIKVPDAEIYDLFAKHGGGWCGAAYYSLYAHNFLPKDIDRILYLDAGDVIVIGDISPYYFCDFENKSLLVTGARFKYGENSLELFTQDDMSDWKNGLSAIVRGLFNSGSYMINLKKMRECGISLNDYKALSEALTQISKDKSNAYFGDQGLISAAFVGDIKYYDFPTVKSVWYMPYNFCMWYYDRMNEKPNYNPSIIHYAGSYKPWECEYPIPSEYFAKGKDKHSLSELKIGQAEYYYMWHEYALMTEQRLKTL